MFYFSRAQTLPTRTCTDCKFIRGHRYTQYQCEVSAPLPNGVTGAPPSTRTRAWYQLIASRYKCCAAAHPHWVISAERMRAVQQLLPVCLTIATNDLSAHALWAFVSAGRANDLSTTYHSDVCVYMAHSSFARLIAHSVRASDGHFHVNYARSGQQLRLISNERIDAIVRSMSSLHFTLSRVLTDYSRRHPIAPPHACAHLFRAHSLCARSAQSNS